MNVNEYGISFVFAASFNMSAETSLQLVFTKPDGSTLTKNSPDVFIVNAPLTTNLGVLPPNTYAVYNFEPGDVDQKGAWSARLIYNDAGPQHLISNIATFTVGP